VLPWRRLAPLSLLALALAGCGGAAGTDSPQQPPASRFRGSEVRPPLAAADFRLRDQDGRLVTLAGQRGRVTVLAFLYTHCPDVCPLIAQNLNFALRQLTPAERAQTRVLAISVDPQGDTPRAVRQFVLRHRLVAQFRYLTGSEQQLSRVWRAYHLAVRPGRLDTIDHSAYELLVDRRGRGLAIYDARVVAADVAHDVRTLLAK
jgi:protein SCO1